MNCVILQPSYIPWRGFFDLVAQADVFVFYDDVQYDKHGWRNRNRIKTPTGTQWLTIPVLHRGNVEDGVEIREVRTDGRTKWARKHWQSVRQNYAKAPHFARYAPMIEQLYDGAGEGLCDFTIASTIALAREIGIAHTRFFRSSELGVVGARTTRLVEIVKKVCATRYLSGPSASAYLVESEFSEAGIELAYAVYDYPEYPQLHGAYDAAVSILDTLFMLGPEVGDYTWGPRAKAHRARASGG